MTDIVPLHHRRVGWGVEKGGPPPSDTHPWTVARADVVSGATVGCAAVSGVHKELLPERVEGKKNRSVGGKGFVDGVAEGQCGDCGWGREVRLSCRGGGCGRQANLWGGGEERRRRQTLERKG